MASRAEIYNNIKKLENKYGYKSVNNWPKGNYYEWKFEEDIANKICKEIEDFHRPFVFNELEMQYFIYMVGDFYDPKKSMEKDFRFKLLLSRAIEESLNRKTPRDNIRFKKMVKNVLNPQPIKRRRPKADFKKTCVI